MGVAEATKSRTGRLPNTQPNGFIPELAVEISLDGTPLGSIAVPQDEFLSKSGNVLFRGGITKGWKLPGETNDVLHALTFKVNGVDARESASGVHLSAPRVNRTTNLPVRGTGGEPMVAHIANVSASDESSDQMVTIIVKKLHAVKGNDMGFSLRVNTMPRAVAGPQVRGEVEGLLIEQ